VLPSMHKTQVGVPPENVYALLGPRRECLPEQSKSTKAGVTG